MYAMKVPPRHFKKVVRDGSLFQEVEGGPEKGAGVHAEEVKF